MAITATTLRRDGLQTLASIMDMTPTLLTLMGLPVGEDMDGQVAEGLIERAFLDRFPRLSQPTHDDRAWLAERKRHVRDEGNASAQDQQERLEQLRSLGYLE